MTIKNTTLAALAALVLAAGGMASHAVAAGGAIAVTVEAKPTPAELAAVKLALGKDDLKALPVQLGHADLNGDHRPDLIFRSYSEGYCWQISTSACATWALLATPAGYARQLIVLAQSDGKVFVLPTMHHGMHDLRYEGGSKTFAWSGKSYQ